MMKTKATTDQRGRIEAALRPVGVELDAIRQYVIDRPRRSELGDWVEQAARWLAAADQ